MKYLLFIFLLIHALSLRAQLPDNSTSGDYSITGIVTDSATGQAMEYATVTLSKTKDQSIVNGTMTAKNGYFKFDNLKPAAYKLKASFLGYRDYVSEVIKVNQGQPATTLKIKLGQNTKSLKEVTITGIKDSYTLDVEKKIYNVGSDINSQGGTAIDVLQNVPSVTVDVQDKVNLRGSDNVTILIDGKPSSMLGSDPSTALQNIPANAIDKIEVITNPSARYDASGMAGIINIVTKKSVLNGLNGNVTAGISSTRRYTTGINLNYRSSKFNLYGAYSFLYNTRVGFGNIFQTNFYTDSISYLQENSTQNQVNRYHVAKAGFDIDINPLNTISFVSAYNYGNESELQTIETNFYNSTDAVTSGMLRDVINPNFEYGWDHSLSYKKTFLKPEEELTAFGQYSISHSSGDNNTFTDQTLAADLSPANDTPSIQVNHSPEETREWTLQTDYILPVTKTDKLEAGLKWDDQIINHQYFGDQFNYSTNTFEPIPSLSDNFNYDEQVSAAYADYSTIFHSLSIKAGLRAEHTHLNFNQLTITESFSQDYTDLFPSVFFSKKIKKSTELQLSYSKRINRPNDRNLDPIPDYTDPQNIREGNPNIQPEFQNALEFTTLHYISTGLLSLTLYYRETNNTIQRFKTVDSLGIGTLTFVNLDHSYNYGVEALVKNSFTKWLDVTASLNGYGNQLDGNNLNAGIVTNDFIINAKLNLSARFLKDFTGQIQGYYTSPQNTVLGHMNASGSMSMGVKRDFLRKRLSANLSLSDVFNTQHFSLIFTGNNFVQDFYRKKTSRILTLNLTYLFGQGNDNNKQQRHQDLPQNPQPEDY